MSELEELFDLLRTIEKHPFTGPAIVTFFTDGSGYWRLAGWPETRKLYFDTVQQAIQEIYEKFYVRG